MDNIAMDRENVNKFLSILIYEKLLMETGHK